MGGKKRCVSFLFRPKDTPGEGEGLVSCWSPQWKGGQDGGGHTIVWEGPGRLWLLTDKASDQEPRKNPPTQSLCRQNHCQHAVWGLT